MEGPAAAGCKHPEQLYKADRFPARGLSPNRSWKGQPRECEAHGLWAQNQPRYLTLCSEKHLIETFLN